MPTFTECLKPVYNDIARYSRALCARWSPNEAEDVLQQALIQGFEHFDQLEDVTKFRPWMFAIVTRTFYSAIRSHFWKRFVSIEENRSAVEDMPCVYDAQEQSQHRQILSDALSRLKAKDRAAILLFEVCGFTIQEIASIQNEKSLSAVKSRLSRARNRLKEHILKQEKGFCVEHALDIDIEHEAHRLVSEIRTLPNQE